MAHDIPSPTVLVVGEKEAVCMHKASEYVAQFLPNAHVIEAPEADHTIDHPLYISTLAVASAVLTTAMETAQSSRRNS